MTARSNRFVRAAARRLPITGAYERRIAELTALVGHLEAQRNAVPADSPSPTPTLFRPPGHFYSPIVDVDDVRVHSARIFGLPVDDIAGVDLCIEQQWALYDRLRPLLREARFAADAADAAARGERYHYDNSAFNDGDAAVLTALLRHFRPRRVIEVGCGFSSACLLDARDRHPDHPFDITFVDPYPQLLESLLRDTDRSSVEVRAQRTQDVDLDVFRTLDENDVLFVDSTHVSKTGSDVNRVVFDILPSLHAGVVVHLHDFMAGFEYPPDWVEEGRSWNEQYLVRAFLQYNDSFEVLLWPQLLRNLDLGELLRDVPVFTNGGGSLWLRKVR